MKKLYMLGFPPFITFILHFLSSVTQVLQMLFADYSLSIYILLIHTVALLKDRKSGGQTLKFEVTWKFGMQEIFFHKYVL